MHMGTEQVIDGFVLLAAEADKVTFICLDAQMPRAEFEKLIARQLRD